MIQARKNKFRNLHLQQPQIDSSSGVLVLITSTHYFIFVALMKCYLRSQTS